MGARRGDVEERGDARRCAARAMRHVARLLSKRGCESEDFPASSIEGHNKNASHNSTFASLDLFCGVGSSAPEPSCKAVRTAPPLAGSWQQTALEGQFKEVRARAVSGRKEPARGAAAARTEPMAPTTHAVLLSFASSATSGPAGGEEASRGRRLQRGQKRALRAEQKKGTCIAARGVLCDGSNAHLVWSAQCRRPGSGKLGRKVAHDAPSDAVQGRRKRPSHVTAKSPPLGTPRPDIALEGYETLSRWGGSPVSLLTPRDFAHLTTAAWSDRALGGCNGRMVVSVELWVVCCISDVLYGRYRSRPHRQSRSPSQKRHNHKSNLLELWASTTWACNGRTAISVDVWVYAVTMTCGIRSQHACAAVGTNWSRHKRV